MLFDIGVHACSLEWGGGPLFWCTVTPERRMRSMGCVSSTTSKCCLTAMPCACGGRALGVAVCDAPKGEQAMARVLPDQTFPNSSMPATLSQHLYQGSKSDVCVSLLVSTCVCRSQGLMSAGSLPCPCRSWWLSHSPGRAVLQNPGSSIITPWHRASWGEELLMDGHTSVSPQYLPRLLWPRRVKRERNYITQCQLCWKFFFPACSWPG